MLPVAPATTDTLSFYDNPNDTADCPRAGRSRKIHPADSLLPLTVCHAHPAETALDAEIRLYDSLFTVPDPDGEEYLKVLNPDSLQVLTGSKVEPFLKDAAPESAYQFMRQGYFCVDNTDSSPEHLVFNRTVSLKDGFKKKK